MTKLRPQVITGILCATFFGCFAIWIGKEMVAVEIVTAVVGALFGFLAGVSLKILENE